MASELAPQYNPKEVEEKIYRMWEESGVFNPNKLPHRKNNFVMIMPPPNITGSLHMGHALEGAISDILIRYQRMRGAKTLWLPGTDHAGIATQNAVEKELKKEGFSRQDLGREKFLERVWQWREKYGGIILGQLKKLGVSADWSRLRFTMDQPYQESVKAAFLHYFKKGWIYQAERVINWCSRCATSISDLELEYREVKGDLYYIKYPLVDGSGDIIVATTRPETMLGDSAVAVNPSDKRYKNFIGKEVLLPLQNRKIPVIADKAVEASFGTGAVKVTPGHDLLDAEIGARHGLGVIKVIGPDGKMTKEAGEVCVGLQVGDCRDRILEELHKQNFLERKEPYAHNVSQCERCGTTIEPLPSLQWFLKMDVLAKRAIRAVKSGKIKFHPSRWEKLYFDWLKNIRDWTISRQIWLGHRLPLGRCIFCKTFIADPKVKGNWFFVRHGETDWNVEERYQGQTAAIHLNERGKTQAQDAGRRLESYPIDLIVSSDAPRAKETAEIIAKILKTEVILDVGFRERHYGVLEGLSVEEIERGGLKEIRKNIFKREFALPGGESLYEVERRVLSALRHHQDRHRHKNIVIVSHGSVLRSLLRKLRNIQPGDPTDVPLHNAQIVHLSLADPCPKCGGDFMELENDVLDTWFSSALWPFAALGWPKNTRDLKNFYPSHILTNDRGIINLWDSRMIFSGLEFMKKAPFRDLIIHATILTKEGKRMSKSLGTGVDPMDFISRFGADATRFGLVWQDMGHQDIRWSEEHVLAGKKFANKIWNASRFVLAHLIDANFKIPIKFKPQTAEDKKILKEFGKIKKEISRRIEKYECGPALHMLYDFFWHQFCDKYLEASKLKLLDRRLKANTQIILYTVLRDSLRMLHPFMPFVTEEIWSHLPAKQKKLLIIEIWPK